MIQLSLSMLPFLVAALLDLMFPLTSWRTEQLVKAKLQYEGLRQEELQAVLAHAQYSADASQMFSSTVISLASVVALPLCSQKVEYGVLLVFGILFVVILLFLYLGRTSVYTHALQRIGPYSWVALLSLFLNSLLVVLMSLESS